MKKIIKLVFILLIGTSASAFAQYHGDSVMSPNDNTSKNSSTQTSGNYTPPTYSTLNLNDVQYGTCPAGFTYAGGSQYPIQMRTLTNYYLGGIYVGQSQSAWYDTDASCNAIQYQTIGCPAGYTGNQLQSRTVSTSNGYYDYSGWNTYQNNCVYVPPPPTKKPGNTNILTVNGWAGWDNSGGDAGASKVAGTLNLSIDNATAKWMCSVNAPFGNTYNPAPGVSIPDVSGSSFTCQISGDDVYVKQGCATTTGGDADMCVDAYYSLRIISRSGDGCNVTFKDNGRNVWANLGTRTLYLCNE
jgi:hypothetical protein